MSDVLGSVWNGFLFAVKWIVIAVLTVLRYAFELVKLFILLLGIVLRLFVALVRAGTP